MEWKKIVIHHSASSGRGKDGKLVDVKTIRRWHLERGWYDIGYHFVVLLDGRVQFGRPLTEKGAHCAAGNRNLSAIGICVVGDFSKENIFEKQILGLAGLAKGLTRKYGISNKDIELHREVPGANTLCPGTLFPAERFRALLQKE